MSQAALNRLGNTPQQQLLVVMMCGSGEPCQHVGLMAQHLSEATPADQLLPQQEASPA
jgi:hypothetical protein